MFAITIIAANYAHFARALATSFLEHNPGSQFFALLIDAAGNEAVLNANEPYSILTPRDLSLDNEEFRRMALMYDVTELATALKPWALEALLDKGAEVAVYLDPDIYVYAPLDNVESAALEHGIVLTPHGLSPMERDGKEPSEAVIMQSGIYNLGFIAINGGRRDFLAWWKERLLRDSISAPEQMLFTDQRWIDLVPGYWPVHILREPGLNVAYWNVDKRALTEEGEHVYVDGHPLQFFHFSGFDPKKTWQLSKHTVRAPRVLLSENPVLARLCGEYADELTKGGLPDSGAEYAFGRLTTGARITTNLRRVYRERIVDEDKTGRRILPTPFSALDFELIEALTVPLVQQPLVNDFMMMAWNRRPDVQAVYPDPLDANARDFNEWCRSSGVREGLLEEWQIVQPAGAKTKTVALKQVSSRGVNLHGYLTAELGMGELARVVLQAIDAAGIPYSAVVNERHASRNKADITLSARTVSYPIDIAVINADQIQAWADDALIARSEGQTRVGVWAWEVEEFPPQFDHAFDYVDEVWAISQFSQRAIQRRTRKPVFTIPLPQSVDNPDGESTLNLSGLGISPKPYFLVIFDYLSVIDRKNPFAAISAFTQAFGEADDVQLVIKTINGDKRVMDRERLLHATRGHKQIHVIEQYLLSSEVSDLMRGALAYVSLHRSEGYGLTCSEAMALRVPVIATGYSGNVDFMNEENSLLVPYELVAVDPSVGVYPSSTVWADANIDVASSYMRKMFDEPAEARRIAEIGFNSIRDSDTLGQAAAFVTSRIDALMATQQRRPADMTVRSDSPHPAEGLVGRVARKLARPLKNWLRKIRHGL